MANMWDVDWNECIALKPIYLNRMSHILEQLYEDGYLATFIVTLPYLVLTALDARYLMELE